MERYQWKYTRKLLPSASRGSALHREAQDEQPPEPLSSPGPHQDGRSPHPRRRRQDLQL